MFFKKFVVLLFPECGEGTRAVAWYLHRIRIYMMMMMKKKQKKKRTEGEQRLGEYSEVYQKEMES